MICLIDGDVILYRSAYANENEEDFNKVKEYIYTLLFEILINNSTDSYIAYLTGPNNFRYSIPRDNSYKSTRTKEKPKWFYEVKKFLISELGFYLTERIEADDALIISNKKRDNGIICTNDKDLLQVPGNFYNITKKNSFKLEPAEAYTNFWKQMLMGDVSDNVKCIYGIGPKGAEKILKGLDESSMRHRVFGIYVDKFGEYEGIIKFYENYRMLRLLDTYEDFNEPEVIKIDTLKPIESYVRKNV